MSPRDKQEIGPDGCPLSPDDPWNRDKRTAAQIQAERFGQEMRRCERAWRSGVADAVADAILLCEKFRAPPPKWLSEAVRIVVERDVLGAATRKWDMIHFRRWDAVRDLRDRKGERDVPKTWQGCYDLVSEEFERTADVARGRPDTIRASYKDVTKRMKSRRRAARYYLSQKKPG